MGLNIETNLAKGNYQFAIEDYYNKKRNLELAERIEKKNQIKFTEGIASSFDLREAQTQLYKSQQSYLLSMLTIISSLIFSCQSDNKSIEEVINSNDIDLIKLKRKEITDNQQEIYKKISLIDE